MELDRKQEFTDMEDPEVGQSWSLPMCVKCIYREGTKCLKFKKTISDITEVDIHDCPEFVEDSKDDAIKLMGL